MKYQIKLPPPVSSIIDNKTTITNTTTGESQIYTENSIQSLSDNKCGDNLTWSFYFDTMSCTIEINGTGDMYDYSANNPAPWNKLLDEHYSTFITINDGVTSIGDMAFSDCPNLYSITIPNSVTSIGDMAFSDCSSLYSITISNSITSIGESAFYMCPRLTDVYYNAPEIQWKQISIEYGNENLTNATIHYNNLTWSLTDDGTLTISGTGDMYDYSANNPAPWDSSAITSINISDGVTSINPNVFRSCKNLTQILVDNNNNIYCSQDGILFNKDKTSLIYYPEGKTETSYVIPDSVTSIGDYAFRYCSNLINITIPDSVTSIGNYAFDGCKLTTINIPDSVTSIGSYAFANNNLATISIPNNVTSINHTTFMNCYSLTQILVDNNNNIYCSQDGILFNKDKTRLICYPEGKTETSYIIPDTVTSIGDGAFEYCRNLTSITIPDTVTSIGFNNFMKHDLNIYYGGSETQWNDLFTGWGLIDVYAIVHFNSTAPDNPNPDTPDTLPISPEDGGLGQEITVNITGGHWLTVQVKRNNSIVISSIQAPVTEDGSKVPVTFSASKSSTIQVWETEEKMTFTNDGAPENKIIATASESL